MKIICIGRNYVDHIDELKNDIPKNPIIFFKPSICRLGGSNFKIPDFSSDIHHEIEIIYKISGGGMNISISDSLNYITGIGLGIDFTARDIQTKFKKKGLPWGISKSFKNSAAISELKSIDKFKDIKNINFSLSKNSVEVQTGNTKLMIFKIEYIIHYISQFIPLEENDIIFSGTPKGVNKIEVGDNLEGYIENEKILNINII
jgi:2-keto-4-pentenoate hydratase/2-oxohepta-3-ene-1,7-dioic acid hydratase in catechol pathway